MGRVLTFSGILLAFGTYTLAVVEGHGYLGFLALAWEDAWAGQMLVDLAIALTLLLGFIEADAKERGLPFWPYLALTVTTGAIGPLSYMLHRSLHDFRHERMATAD